MSDAFRADHGDVTRHGKFLCPGDHLLASWGSDYTSLNKVFDIPKEIVKVPPPPPPPSRYLYFVPAAARDAAPYLPAGDSTS